MFQPRKRKPDTGRKGEIEVKNGRGKDLTFHTAFPVGGGAMFHGLPAFGASRPMFHAFSFCVVCCICSTGNVPLVAFHALTGFLGRAIGCTKWLFSGVLAVPCPSHPVPVLHRLSYGHGKKGRFPRYIMFARVLYAPPCFCTLSPKLCKIP